MYEHLRNDLQNALMVNFDMASVDMIMGALDKVASNYDIAEKTTALAVLDDERLKLVRYYLAAKKTEGLSDNSIALYGRTLKIFFEQVEKVTQDITTNDVRLFLAQYKQQRKVSDRALDKYRQVICGFFTWCQNEEYIVKNPCKNIHSMRYEVEPRRALTRLQLERVRRSCKTKRDLAIVDVLYSTGCRVNELVNMRLSDVDFMNNSIEIVGKGRKHNTVYLNEAARISLDEYLQDRKGSDDHLFVSDKKPYGKLTTRTIEHIFSKIGEQFNMRLTPHILRHTSATLALQSGMSITQVQKMLGHSSVNTTQIYAETMQEDVANAHRRYVI